MDRPANDEPLKGKVDHAEIAPLDLDDPHAAALENASEPAQIPPASTILAVAVCFTAQFGSMVVN